MYVYIYIHTYICIYCPGKPKAPQVLMMLLKINDSMESALWLSALSTVTPSFYMTWRAGFASPIGLSSHAHRHGPLFKSVTTTRKMTSNL